MVGGRIENAKVPTVMYEKAVHLEHKRPAYHEFDAEKRCFGTGVGDDGGTA